MEVSPFAKNRTDKKETSTGQKMDMPWTAADFLVVKLINAVD